MLGKIFKKKKYFFYNLVVFEYRNFSFNIFIADQISRLYVHSDMLFEKKYLSKFLKFLSTYIILCNIFHKVKKKKELHLVPKISIIDPYFLFYFMNLSHFSDKSIIIWEKDWNFKLILLQSESSMAKNNI